VNFSTSEDKDKDIQKRHEYANKDKDTNIRSNTTFNINMWFIIFKTFPNNGMQFY
jgi:hypothetical protein